MTRVKETFGRRLWSMLMQPSMNKMDVAAWVLLLETTREGH